jgi:hypothetical protein
MSLCVKGSEPEGGGAIIGSCCMRLREFVEVLFFVYSSRGAVLLAKIDRDRVLQRNKEFVWLGSARSCKKNGWSEPCGTSDDDCRHS